MRKEKNQKLFGVLVGIIIILMSIILGMQILSPVINDSSETPGVAIQPSEEQPVEPKPVEPAQPKEYVQIVFIGKNDTGEEVYKVIKKSADKNILKSVKVFDIYEGKGIDEGKKSLAFRVTLQDENKTLTDDIIQGEVNKIKSGLEKNIIGLILR